MCFNDFLLKSAKPYSVFFWTRNFSLEQENFREFLEKGFEFSLIILIIRTLNLELRRNLVNLIGKTHNT